MTDTRAQRKEHLLAFLHTIQKAGRPIAELGERDPMVASGLIDSLAILQIVSYLESTYDIDFSMRGVDPGANGLHREHFGFDRTGKVMSADSGNHISHGQRMRDALAKSDIVPFIGVYDVFSATVAGRQFDALFVSGFGFAASFYGLPDVGFITWSDIVAYVQRIRTVLPTHHLLVDIDDGYCDPEVACHVVSLLEASGASGVVLEDQKRPRRCGHFEGKQIMELDEYLAKLRQVLATRRDLFVVARTDSSDPDRYRASRPRLCRGRS